MSLHSLLVLFFLLVVPATSAAVRSDDLLALNDVPADLSGLFKRKEAAIPFEFSENLLKAMLKYRRY
ncbi:hypothetical protein Q1695_010942 [Nippostrongylus brasiliensis]|nr:hypothetical protein Q1695_010942 [Nippostrongylus brasiliensis]